MKILEVVFELFVLYLLYKLIFDFIIPVYQTARQVKQKVGEMQQKMNEHMEQKSASFKTEPVPPSQKAGKEDYIEFEEVK